jgi:calcineurin-like phosphoesterase
LVPQRLEVADSDVVQVNAVQFTVDEATGVCRSVERVNTVINLANNLP